jgi:SsrA-binding protein
MKILVQNRRARFDYSIEDELIAGIELSGAEVKSLKSSQGSLAGAHISIRGGEAFLVHLHVSPYAKAGGANATKTDPERDRKLLLNRSELDSLIGKEKGSVIIPIEVLQTGRGLVKVKIGVGHGKKKYDKRETIKKRDIDKQIRKAKLR